MNKFIQVALTLQSSLQLNLNSVAEFVFFLMTAKVVLEDGTEISGEAFGEETSVSGEVVFATGMVGYPESLTDPSYKGQILVLTYPLIGNYGVPGKETDEWGLSKNFESDGIQISGLVVSDCVSAYSHWNAKKSLSEWLKEHGVPGIQGIDTRMLTKKLRQKGTMLGKIVNGGDVELSDPNLRNLAAEVSVKEKVAYNTGGKRKIILIDCGVKLNIIRNLIRRDCEVIRVPWDYDFLSEDFDGVVISNGPGDPKTCGAAIRNVAAAMQKGVPVFGICLGNQLMALAAGGDTYKLKYGHRSQNQPCTEKETGRCYITTQNHGYAVDAKSLGNDWEEWLVNANDGTNEGIKHKTKPFFSVQHHPESSPGPVDTEWLFDRFLEQIK